MTTTTLADFTATTLAGAEQPLADYSGKVVLVVNTASKCGLAQFEGLQHLYEKYKDDGVVILGFPSDQFAGQEYDDAEKISEHCRVNYGVTFPMFSKVDVNGRDAHPLFRWLRKETGGFLTDAIKWNFTKFLIGRDGRIVRRYAPTDAPESIEADLCALLEGGSAKA